MRRLAIQAVALHLLVERRPVDVELLGCCLTAPSVRTKRSLKNSLFRFSQRFLQRHRLITLTRRRHGCLCNELFGKVLNADAVTLAQNHGTLDDVFQLPHVTRPAVSLKDVDYFLVEIEHLPLHLSTKMVQEMFGEQWNVTDPLSEAGHLDR